MMKWKNMNFKNRSYTLCDHVIWSKVGGASPYVEVGTRNVKSDEGFERNLFKTEGPLKRNSGEKNIHPVGFKKRIRGKFLDQRVR
jgi:hypothetical protein